MGSTFSLRWVRRQCSQKRLQHSRFSHASILLARTLTCWQKWQYLLWFAFVSVAGASADPQSTSSSGVEIWDGRRLRRAEPAEAPRALAAGDGSVPVSAAGRAGPRVAVLARRPVAAGVGLACDAPSMCRESLLLSTLGTFRAGGLMSASSAYCSHLPSRPRVRPSALRPASSAAGPVGGPGTLGLWGWAPRVLLDTQTIWDPGSSFKSLQASRGSPPSADPGCRRLRPSPEVRATGWSRCGHASGVRSGAR
mmetsp:Transcript_7037/g.13578  ORF Transcript_7037/g.13578 Transcript_7037/m.13578 type:complete len:252 (-) Transcript_7037:34-789(-)